ncbi:MAG: LacI family DNA-binding transcriptional regulator [Planctomycetota bacterium]
MSPRKRESKRARFVALLLPESQKLLDDKSYYGPMLQGLSDALRDAGLGLRPVECLHEYQRAHFLHSPASFYAGVVVMGQLYTARDFVEEVVRALSGPKVVLDHHFEDVPMHSVREDAVEGMRKMAGHLIEGGHRHIAYLDNDDPNANPWKREGINRALTEAGLPELARGWVAGCRCNFSDTATALDWFTGLEPRPTAVMTCGDIRALLLLQAAAELGMRVPADISITGYGELAARTGRSRVLSSVGVDPAEMGRRAAELVLGDERDAPLSVLVPPELALRGTTGPPAG